MNTTDAVALIRDAIPNRGGTWADVGAGEGAFTRALVELVGPSRIYAVDSDARALEKLTRWAKKADANVIPVVADFSSRFEFPGLSSDAPGSSGPQLDGMLLANSLHFVGDPTRVLSGLVSWLRPGGRVVLVEYDGRKANRWVPHPIPASQWAALAESVGLSNPVVTATRPSAFGGDLYVAIADR